MYIEFYLHVNIMFGTKSWREIVERIVSFELCVLQGDSVFIFHLKLCVLVAPEFVQSNCHVVVDDD